MVMADLVILTKDTVYGLVLDPLFAQVRKLMIKAIWCSGLVRLLRKVFSDEIIVATT